jgi:hypothetical protein
MVRNRLPHQIFIENYNPERARLITDNALHMSKGAVDLVYSSFNRLQFRVISEMPAFFGLSYPYTGHWGAWVNGSQVRVYRANGASHAVEIPKGESLIEFRYWSNAAFWGIVVSCITFVLLGLYVCFISFLGVPRVIAAVFLLIIGVGFVILWNHSLYTGDNLGTQYIWTYIPPESTPNKAYGKKTFSFPLPNRWQKEIGIFINHSSRIVDGNKNKGSGFRMFLENDFDVTIDLYHGERINSLIIYESALDNSVINRHFELFISLDQKNWKRVASITPELKYHHPIRIDFDSPQTARYIQIKASGSRKIILDEVEVY